MIYRAFICAPHSLGGSLLALAARTEKPEVHLYIYMCPEAQFFLGWNNPASCRVAGLEHRDRPSPHSGAGQVP